MSGEPTTEAGIALLDTLDRGLKLFAEDRRTAILAIENEAANAERERLRDGLNRLDWSHVGIYGEYVSVDDVRRLLSEPPAESER